MTETTGSVGLRAWYESARVRWHVGVLVNGVVVGNLTLTPNEYAVLTAALGSDRSGS